LFTAAEQLRQYIPRYRHQPFRGRDLSEVKLSDDELRKAARRFRAACIPQLRPKLRVRPLGRAATIRRGHYKKNRVVAKMRFLPNVAVLSMPVKKKSDNLDSVDIFFFTPMEA
jgi:hypothetical protein